MNSLIHHVRVFFSWAVHSPSLRTSTLSLSMTVGIRCAIVRTVQELNSVRNVRWIRLSVALSTDAVASSRTRIRVCFNKARPRHTSCRCPALQFSPFSPTTTNPQNHVERFKTPTSYYRNQWSKQFSYLISCFSLMPYRILSSNKNVILTIKLVFISKKTPKVIS